MNRIFIAAKNQLRGSARSMYRIQMQPEIDGLWRVKANYSFECHFMSPICQSSMAIIQSGFHRASFVIVAYVIGKPGN